MVSEVLWTAIGSVAAVIGVAVSIYLAVQRERRNRPGQDTASLAGKPTQDTSAAGSGLWSRRQQLGRELRSARQARGLSSENLASQLPGPDGTGHARKSWVELVEQQPERSAAGRREPPLPDRAQLIAWSRACGLSSHRLLDRAKVLLPEIYPATILPPPAQPLSTFSVAADWRTEGYAESSQVVDRVRSLLQQADSHANAVDLTFIGPLVTALSSAAAIGSVLDPVRGELAQCMESRIKVRHLWSVDGPVGQALDWFKLIPGLLTLAGQRGSYDALATTHRREHTMDFVALSGRGGLIVLRRPEGFVTIPVLGDVGASALAAHFDYLIGDHQATDLFRQFSWGSSPEKLVDWENAMADADEAAGWRMLIQPRLGDVTMPESVQTSVMDRWRASCHPSKIAQSYNLEKARNRRRNGFELSLSEHPAYDIMAGPAFEQFVTRGALQQDWISETPEERLVHLNRLLELLRCENYHLVIVDGAHDMYSEIFGDDRGTRADRELYYLLKERTGDKPSAFTSTYWFRTKSRSFEIRHPRLFSGYRKQAEYLLTYLAPAIQDKSAVTQQIEAAIRRVRSLPGADGAGASR